MMNVFALVVMTIGQVLVPSDPIPVGTYRGVQFDSPYTVYCATHNRYTTWQRSVSADGSLHYAKISSRPGPVRIYTAPVVYSYPTYTAYSTYTSYPSWGTWSNYRTPAYGYGAGRSYGYGGGGGGYASNYYGGGGGGGTCRGGMCVR